MSHVLRYELQGLTVVTVTVGATTAWQRSSVTPPEKAVLPWTFGTATGVNESPVVADLKSSTWVAIGGSF